MAKRWGGNEKQLSLAQGLKNRPKFGGFDGGRFFQISTLFT
jgi:hypothetical protein